MSGELDLSRPEDVLRYLAETPFASSRVDSLSGGTANYIFRLHLERPYKGIQTLVLKHGKAWLPADKSFALSLERQVIFSSLFPTSVHKCVLIKKIVCTSEI